MNADGPGVYSWSAFAAAIACFVGAAFIYRADDVTWMILFFASFVLNIVGMGLSAAATKIRDLENRIAALERRPPTGTGLVAQDRSCP